VRADAITADICHAHVGAFVDIVWGGHCCKTLYIVADKRSLNRYTAGLVTDEGAVETWSRSISPFFRTMPFHLSPLHANDLPKKCGALFGHTVHFMSERSIRRSLDICGLPGANGFPNVRRTVFRLLRMIVTPTRVALVGRTRKHAERGERERAGSARAVHGRASRFRMGESQKPYENRFSG
jgi:hypothetical protein